MLPPAGEYLVLALDREPARSRLGKPYWRYQLQSDLLKAPIIDCATYMKYELGAEYYITITHRPFDGDTYFYVSNSRRK